MRVERYSQFFSGAFQHKGYYHGILQAWGDTYKQCASPTHIVQLDKWNIELKHKAEEIWRLQPKWLQIVGYSAGGWAASTVGRMAQERGIDVDVMLLSDAVHMPLGIASPLALYKGWEIEISKNVKVLRSWSQKHSRPMGHKLVVPKTTDWAHSNITKIRHANMDDLKCFHKACVDYAAGRKP